MQNNLARGQLVRRIADPVHTGMIRRVCYGADVFVNVLWLSKPPIAEHRIPAAALEAAEDWK